MKELRLELISRTGFQTGLAYLLLIHVAMLVSDTATILPVIHVLAITLIALPAASAWMDLEIERNTIQFLRMRPGGPLRAMAPRVAVDLLISAVLAGLHLLLFSFVQGAKISTELALSTLILVLAIAPIGTIVGGISAFSGRRSLLQPLLGIPILIPLFQPVLSYLETGASGSLWLSLAYLPLAWGMFVLLAPLLLEVDA